MNKTLKAIKNYPYRTINPIILCSVSMLFWTPLFYNLVSASLWSLVLGVIVPFGALFTAYKISTKWVNAKETAATSKHITGFVVKYHYLGGNDIVWDGQFDDWYSARLASMIMAYWIDHLGMISYNYGLDYMVKTTSDYYKSVPSREPLVESTAALA